jgi:DNA polymerase-3 subunit alpha
MFTHVWGDRDHQLIYHEYICSGTHFAEMRYAIHKSFEDREYGSRFPVLLQAPATEAVFPSDQTKALREEILTIIDEKGSLVVVPKYSHSIKTVDFIISRLEIILKGCEIALENNGELRWHLDFFDEDKALIMIEETLKYLKTTGKELDIASVPHDDKKTYELISSGNTPEVYLFEDEGMKTILKEVSPINFKDLVALIAFGRPGPQISAMLGDFIRRRKGEIPIKYKYPKVKELLDETYGIIIYHEQITELFQILGGFSLEQAEILKKAMVKKDSEIVSKFKDEFVNGAIKNGLTELGAKQVFQLVNYFAEYSLSRTFATKHATYAYQTAYLKVHYPKEFIALNASLNTQ